MALRKIINVEGEAFVKTVGGQVSIGQQKTAFSAYCKIININGGKTSGVVLVECAGDGYKKTNEYTVNFSVDETAPNFIKQAYLQLKNMPDFEGATDC